METVIFYFAAGIFGALLWEAIKHLFALILKQVKRHLQVRDKAKLVCTVLTNVHGTSYIYGDRRFIPVGPGRHYSLDDLDLGGEL